MKRSVPVLLATFVLLGSAAASAQSPEQKVLRLNGEAMEAYLELDIDRAKKLLEQALTIVERARLEGRPLARTYLNLGIVAVGGDQDRQTAFEFFKAALVADPSIEPDPATNTPQVAETFELAKGRYEMETGKQAGATAPPMAEDGEPQDGGESPWGDGEAEPEAPTDDADWGEQSRYFVDFGLSLGVATAQAGRIADPQPLQNDCVDEATGQLKPGCGSYVPPGQASCDGREFCVRVQSPGILPIIGLKLAAGYYILPRFAVALALRVEFGGGTGVLNQWMGGVRAQYRAVAADPEGLELAPFVGASVGQIQVSPDQGGLKEPYLSSGLGSVQLGTVIAYRFTEWFGIQATPEAHVFFPELMFAAEVTLGVQLAF